MTLATFTLVSKALRAAARARALPRVTAAEPTKSWAERRGAAEDLGELSPRSAKPTDEWTPQAGGQHQPDDPQSNHHGDQDAPAPGEGDTADAVPASRGDGDRDPSRMDQRSGEGVHSDGRHRGGAIDARSLDVALVEAEGADPGRGHLVGEGARELDVHHGPQPQPGAHRSHLGDGGRHVGHRGGAEGAEQPPPLGPLDGGDRLMEGPNLRQQHEHRRPAAGNSKQRARAHPRDLFEGRGDRPVRLSEAAKLSRRGMLSCGAITGAGAARGTRRSPIIEALTLLGRLAPS